MGMFDWIPRTSTVGTWIHGDPAGPDDDPAYEGLNENQRRLLKSARRADAYAMDRNRLASNEHSLRQTWQKDDRVRLDRINRLVASGQNLTPDDIAFAQQHGQAIPEEFHSNLTPEQRQLIPAAQKYMQAPVGALDPKRLQYASGQGADISDLTSLYNATQPELMVTPTGEAINKRDASNVGRVFPQIGEGQIYSPENGSITYAPNYVTSLAGKEAAVQGAGAYAKGAAEAQWAGPIAGAKAAAESEHDLVDITLADGSTMKIPRSVVVQGHRPGAGVPPTLFMGSRSPLAEGADQAAVEAHKRRLEAAQGASATAGGLRQNALLLRSLSGNIQGGSFTPLKGAAANFLRSLGVVGEDSDIANYAGDVKLFGKIAGEQVLTNIRKFGGNPTEGERKFAIELGQMVSDPHAVTSSISTMAIAAANKADDYWQFLQRYEGDPRQAEAEYKKTPYGRYGTFADPEMQALVIKMGGRAQTNSKGELRITLPDGTVIQ